MRSMVEGARDSKHLHSRSNDRIRRFVKVPQQLGCGDAHYGHAVLLEPSVTPLVTLGSIGHVVAYAVNLDREIRFRAVEIEHIWPDRVLTTKNRLSRHALTQLIP